MAEVNAEMHLIQAFCLGLCKKTQKRNLKIQQKISKKLHNIFA